MSDLPAARRQLMIKSGVVKRLAKEHALYKKEAEAQQQKLDKFIADSAEAWDINNGVRPYYSTTSKLQPWIMDYVLDKNDGGSKQDDCGLC